MPRVDRFRIRAEGSYFQWHETLRPQTARVHLFLVKSLAALLQHRSIRVRFMHATQSESLAEPARPMPGIPLSLALVRRMAAFAFSVWHGWASLAPCGRSLASQQATPGAKRSGTKRGQKCRAIVAPPQHMWRFDCGQPTKKPRDAPPEEANGGRPGAGRRFQLCCIENLLKPRPLQIRLQSTRHGRPSTGPRRHSIFDKTPFRCARSINCCVRTRAVPRPFLRSHRPAVDGGLSIRQSELFLSPIHGASRFDGLKPNQCTKPRERGYQITGCAVYQTRRKRRA
jgi:hypothetical protein